MCTECINAKFGSVRSRLGHGMVAGAGVSGVGGGGRMWTECSHGEFG